MFTTWIKTLLLSEKCYLKDEIWPTSLRFFQLVVKRHGWVWIPGAVIPHLVGLSLGTLSSIISSPSSVRLKQKIECKTYAILNFLVASF